MLKETTPVNIFQTYLQGQNTVSPIDFEFNNEFEGIKAVDDDFDLQDLRGSKLNTMDLKTSFKDKIKGIKSDFTHILS